MSPARPILDALMAVTPEPPAADANPGDVLAAVTEMLEARAAPLAELAALTEGGPVDAPDCTAVAAELREREVRWGAALARARGELGMRLAAARRAR